MEFYQKDSFVKPKSRKWFGCLMGCLLVFGFILLVCFFIAWLLFRSQPPLSEEVFFSPEVTGFSRIQIDSLQKGAARELLQNLIRETGHLSQDEKIKERDPDNLWSVFDLILHKRHYLYLYHGEEDGRLGYLLVLDLKRFHWLISSFLKESKTNDVEEIVLPGDLKGRCFRLKIKEGEKFVAVTNSAFFVSDSQDRIKNAITLLRSKDPPGKLASSLKTLIPADDSDDMVNGALLWRGEFTDAVYAWALDKNEELNPVISFIYQALSEKAFDGVSMKCRLSSSEVMMINIGVRCSDADNASLLAGNLTKALNREEMPGAVEKSCFSDENMVHIELLIPGVETWLKAKIEK